MSLLPLLLKIAVAVLVKNAREEGIQFGKKSRTLGINKKKISY